MTRSSRHLAATIAVTFSLLAVSSAWAADKLASADASMLKDIAQANMAEVEPASSRSRRAPTPRSRSSPR